MDKFYRYLVVIDGDTTGDVLSVQIGGEHIDSLMGKRISVRTQDENGNYIQRAGTLTEVLEGMDY